MKKIKLLAASLLASTMILAGCENKGVPHEHTFVSEWTSDATYHWHESACGHDVQGGKGEHSDGDFDHKCDVCEKTISTCVDNDHDNLCDICGADMPRVIGVSITGEPEKLMETKSVTLGVNVQVKGGANKAVTWTASNSNATVDQDGVVTGVKAGSVTITATSDFDNTKFDSVEIEIIELYWTDEELAMFAELLPEPIPFIKGSFVLTDAYLDSYGCLLLQSSVVGDKAAAKKVFDDSDYTYGGLYDDGYGATGYTYYKDSDEFEGEQTLVNIYSYGTPEIVCVEVYFTYIQYTEWPSAKIASYMQDAGFGSMEVIAYPLIEGATVAAAPITYDDGTAGVYIGVSDGESYAEDYAALYNPAEYIVVEYGYEYTISPLDKSCSLYVYDTDNGFDICAQDYIPDERFYIEEEFNMLAIDDELSLTLVKGVDIDPLAVVTWSVDNEESATVSDSGVVHINSVTGDVVTVTAKIEGTDFESSTILYTVEEVPTDFTDAQKAEFNKLHDGLLIPFNKYFDEVAYDEENESVVVSSNKYYSNVLEDYYNALVDDGWVDIIDETYGEGMSYLYYAYGYPFMFEKEIVCAGDVHYWVSLELMCLDLDEDGEPFQNSEGHLCAYLYDGYLYDYADAVAAFEGILEDIEVETTAVLPESIPGSHYLVEYYEEDPYYEEPECVDFTVYDCELTTTQLKEAMEADGWEVEVEHVDATDDEIAYDDIYVFSEDGILEGYGYLYDGDLVLEFYFNDPVSSGVTFDFSEVSVESYDKGVKATIGDFTVDSHKTGNEAASTVYGDEELRVYANNELTISSTGEPITSIDFYTCDCTSKVGATFATTTGTLTVTDYGYHWEGNAMSVTFTCTKVDDNHKQCHFFYIDINGGGEGGGGYETGGIEDLCDEISYILFGTEGAFEYDFETDLYYAFAQPQGSTMMAACTAVANILKEVYVELDGPTADSDEEGDYVIAFYTDDFFENIIQVISYEDDGELVVEIDVYVWEE